MGVIGTHDGCFHCDEVLAVFLLQQLPEFKDYTVLRTRNPDELSTCDVLVDVGGVYDPETLRFDHHQKGFNVTWSKFFDVRMFSVKFSSAGLVYAHFGKRVLSLLTGWDIESEHLKRMFLKPAFWEAVELVGREFLDTVHYFTNCWWPAREFVARAMNKRGTIDNSRTIIVLEQSCPWKGHLFDLEREERAETVVYPEPLRTATSRPEPKYPPKVLFVILPQEDGNWVVQSVSGDNFENRMPLPSSWRSLQNDELSRETGISGCIFVHSAGHLGLNKTLDGAIEMARYTVREFEENELAVLKTLLPPPTFSRGRGRKLTTVQGGRFK